MNQSQLTIACTFGSALGSEGISVPQQTAKQQILCYVVTSRLFSSLGRCVALDWVMASSLFK